MKPVFSLKASVSFGPEGYSVPAFSSCADRVRITAAGTAKGPVSVTVLSHGRDVSPYTVFSGEILPDETGAFAFAYGFDPVHLAVYRAADTFTLTFRAESAVLTALTVGEETEAAASSRAAVLHAHSLHEVGGIPSVPVYRADGTPIFVPALPQNVLLIGNSILLGLFLQYGMCASSPMHDYAGLVTERLKKQNPALSVKKLHGGSFEGLTDAADFERWYTEEANPYTKRPACESFTEDLDLIVVQLGDNVNTDARKAAFPETADRLLARIKEKAPRARVVWVYGWYNKCMMEEALLALADKWKIESIDISPLRDKDAEATKGQLLENPAGGTVVAQDGWITHPGNEGMRRIADAVLALLGTD